MTNEVGKPVWNVEPIMRSRAKRLRSSMTDAERALWNELRAHRLNDASFRRQKPVGPYIVDFINEKAKIIIELDGGQHYEPAGQMRDLKRDAYLVQKGFRVLRFNNLDVLTNRAGVLETIVTAIEVNAPSPTLPRKREREQAASDACENENTRALEGIRGQP